MFCVLKGCAHGRCSGRCGIVAIDEFMRGMENEKNERRRNTTFIVFIRENIGPRQFIFPGMDGVVQG